MGEFQITDAGLVGALCSARANSWQSSVEMAKAQTYSFGGRYYRNFVVKGNFDDADNEVLNKHLGRFTKWQNESLNKILREISNSPDECKGQFARRVETFLMALREMLADIVYEKCYRMGRYEIETDEQTKIVLEERLNHILKLNDSAEEFGTQDFKGIMFDKFFKDEGYNIPFFLANEFEKGGSSVLTMWPLSERLFIKRILIFQELLKRLSALPQRQTKEPVADRAEELNQPTATVAGDGAAADRDKGPGKGNGATVWEEPEYLLKWKENTKGKKHGIWKALFMMTEFRDEIEAMKGEQPKRQPVLKDYWNKHEVLRNKGVFDSFRKGFGKYPKCRELFPE